MKRLLLYLALMFTSVNAPEVEEFSQEQIEMYESLTEINPEVKKAIEPVIILPDTVPLHGDLQVYGQQLCYKYKISWSLVLAVLESESSFIWEEEGRDIGYMQIRDVNWGRYDGLDAHDPYDNLEIGIRMLAELKEKYGEFDKIIMAYKGGESAMKRWVEEGYTLPCCETISERQNYWEGELDDTRCK